MKRELNKSTLQRLVLGRCVLRARLSGCPHHRRRPSRRRQAAALLHRAARVDPAARKATQRANSPRRARRHRKLAALPRPARRPRSRQRPRAAEESIKQIKESHSQPTALPFQCVEPQTHINAMEPPSRNWCTWHAHISVAGSPKRHSCTRRSGARRLLAVHRLKVKCLAPAIPRGGGLRRRSPGTSKVDGPQFIISSMLVMMTVALVMAMVIAFSDASARARSHCVLLALADQIHWRRYLHMLTALQRAYDVAVTVFPIAASKSLQRNRT